MTISNRKLCERYHESVKDKISGIEPWSELPGSNGMGRDMKFFKPVNLPGLKDTRGVKIQRLRKFGTYGLLVCSCTKLEDVPSADTFSVDDMLAVTSIEGGTKVMVEINFQVTFIKSTMLKYMIETNTNTEMKKWLDNFFAHLGKAAALHKEGKIDFNVGLADGEGEQEEEEEETPEEAPKSMIEAFKDSLFNFKDQTLGDQVKTVVLLLFVVFFVFNYRQWQSAMNRSKGLEKKLDDLEELVKVLVETSKQCVAEK